MDIDSMKSIWSAWKEVTEKKKLSPAQRKHFDKDNDGDIDDADMALLNKKKEESSCGKMRKEEKVKCPKCEGKGCDHCDDTGYHMKEEAPDAHIKQQPLRRGDKSNAQPSELKTEEAEVAEFFESLSEEQLDELSKNLLTRYKKKADAQTTDHMKKFDHGGKKPSAASTANFNKRHAGSNTADDKIKGKYVKVPATVKKEEADWLADLAAQLEAMEIAEKKDAHTKGATKPEGIMDKESPKSKEFADKHKGESEFKDYDEKGHDDVSKAGREGVKSQSPARGSADKLSNGDKKPVK